MDIFRIIKRRLRRGGNNRCTAVIAAGGSSNRMGGENKLFSLIDGIPVLARTLMVFEASPLIHDIVLVAREEDIPACAVICTEYNIKKLIRVEKGAPTRPESVYNGVNAVPRESGLIAIADGCRPFVTEEVISAAIKSASRHGAAAPAVPVKDTIKTAKNGVVTSTPDRSSLFAIQTPQVFDADLIKCALKYVLDKNITVTDDCMAVEALGGSVRLTEGSYENIKITTPEDLFMGEKILEKRGGTK